MREIIFRGKIDDYDHKWVYGSLLSGGCLEDIVIRILNNETGDEEDVIPDTVGQFTGLTDKNGKKIFEGDILKVKTGWYRSNKESKNDKFDVSVKGLTYWTVDYKIYNCEMGFFTFGIDRRFHKPLTQSRLFNVDAEVCGNVYDNPEMLKSKVD